MGEAGNRGSLTIIVTIGGLPRRLKRPRDWESFIQNRELSETDLVRVERPAAEPADMFAVDVPELRLLFEKYFPKPEPVGIAAESEAEAVEPDAVPAASAGHADPPATEAPKTTIEAARPEVRQAGVSGKSAGVPPWLVVKPAAFAPSVSSKSSSFSPEATLANRKLLGKILLGALVAIVFIWLMSLIAAALKPAVRTGSGGAPAPLAQEQAVTVYTTREVGVRPAPTTINTIRLALLPRGTRLDGVWVKSADGQNDWLKISSGAYAGDYVWGGNLSSQYIEPETPILPPSNSLAAPTDAATVAPADNPGSNAAGPAGVPANPVSPAVPVASAKPSFDCRRANTWSENAVCSSPSLAGLDILMASAYRELLQRSQPAVRQEAVLSQRAWLQQRATCEQSAVPAACMDQLYRQRIAELKAGLQNARFTPTAPETPVIDDQSVGDTAQSRIRSGPIVTDPCPQPATPRSIDGNLATSAQMAVARDEVVAFLRASDVFQSCVLNHARGSDDPHARAIIAANQNLKEHVGAAYNSAVLAYKARN